MVVKNLQKISYKFFCEECNYKCSKQSEYNKHLLTAKHKMVVNGSKNGSKKSPLHIHTSDDSNTCICGKKYKYESGYYRHKKTCNISAEQNNSIYSKATDESYNTTLHTMVELIKQNQEFKQLLIEQNQTILAISKKDTITTNNNTINNNQKFNLNFFLNTTCKDAMNMSEFIENIDINFTDIENIGKHGYISGMTNMFLSRIKDLDITKRPLHCTDLKRETMYIKDNDEWCKDTSDNEKLHKMISIINKRSYSTIPLWRDKHPECLEYTNPKYEFCMDMMKNVLGDVGQEQLNLDRKVIKNISRSIFIK